MKKIQAIAVFPKEMNSVQGIVRFTEDIPNHSVIIDVDIVGLRPNAEHGFHIHEAGDLTDKCTSMCSHFNPYNKKHGCPEMTERHVGDLGNLVTDVKGRAKYQFRDNIIQLRGNKRNIIGRGLVIHADRDDCGLGGDAESLKTGNAGKRIACAVIGYAKQNFI